MERALKAIKKDEYFLFCEYESRYGVCGPLKKAGVLKSSLRTTFPVGIRFLLSESISPQFVKLSFKRMILISLLDI